MSSLISMLKGNQTRAKVVKPYVFIVYECADNTVGSGGVVHGVYLNREEADGKKAKLERRGNANWLAVLKKPLQGKDLLC